METFQVHVLGCGSALPTLRHEASAQVVELKDKLFLVDCGEGTQVNLRRSHLRFTKINAVFITHLHGDHCFGLIGLISTFGMLGRLAPLHVYAPAALEALLLSQLQLFCNGMEYEVVFHAVDTTRHAVVYEDNSLTVSTLPLEHRVPCCGYLFREKPTLPHIRRDMIDCFEISLAQIHNIKKGADGIAADGRIIPHEQLVTPSHTPRSYAYCSDTRYIPTLHQLVKGVNLLYHEATYHEEWEERARRYYHSTAAQAARVALDAGVGQLMLGHYSARYDNEQQLLDEARTIFPNTLLANEGLVVDVGVKI